MLIKLIEFTNQRSPAERGPGPFEGPSSYLQLCWWSLISFDRNILNLFPDPLIIEKTGNIATVQRQLGHTNAADSIQYARVIDQEIAEALDER